MSYLSRRSFNKQVAVAAIGTAAFSNLYAGKGGKNRIRLGGPVNRNEYKSPEEWIAILRDRGYAAAQCPVTPATDDQTVQAYEMAARKADVTIAEVGAWSNPICPLDKVRKPAIEKCISHLALADRIGARCCVNVTGTLAEEGIGTPHPGNMSADTFDLIVETTRKIIDAVKPTRSYYTLETMPWAYPNSAQSVLDLMKAIDRPALAAHFDPVNLVNSPDVYFNNGAMIKDAFKKLGPYIRSCHAKDTLLSTTLTTHLDEVVPGTGKLDYATYLTELSKLNGVPLMMEHMKKDEYPVAAKYIRGVGKKLGIPVS